MLLRHRMTPLRVTSCDRRFAAQRMQNRRIVPSEALRVSMMDHVRTFKCISHLCNGSVDIAENPEHPRHESHDGHASVLAGRPSSYLVGFPTCAEHLSGVFDCLAGFDDAP